MNNRVTLDDVNNFIIKEEYVKLGTKMTACVLTLKNGHEVVGIAGVIDAKTYDLSIGSTISKNKAVDKVWALLGFRLQDRLYNQSITV